MGLSFHNSLAVLQGYLGRKSPFVRTPKYDVLKMGEKIREKKYFSARMGTVSIMEGAFFIYFLAGLTWSIYHQEPSFLFMHFLLTVGYGLIFYFSLKNLWVR